MCIYNDKRLLHIYIALLKEEAGLAVTLKARIREVLDSNLG
jgi:hypothetical protein